VYLREVEPLVGVLEEVRSDQQFIRRVATAIVREARRVEIAPEILIAVLLVENPDLDEAAVSPAGAFGLMQVMPLHRGEWRACRESLESIEGNICYGAQIFAYNLRQSNGDIRRALLRYNGCVRGTNTPNCRAYPEKVFASAGRVILRELH
jgi:soluble lytic murein transglycosylase-like protein